MSNDIAMCAYHSIAMHNDVAMDLYFYLLWVVWNKNKKFMFNQSWLEKLYLLFWVGLFHMSFRYVKYPYTKRTSIVANL